MKVSQNWLKELVEINLSPEELSEKLSIGGFEVESLLDCSQNVQGVVLGKVISVVKHTGSDKLSICKVDIGNNDLLQIICGAKNIRKDIYVYVAKVGSHLNAINLSQSQFSVIFAGIPSLFTAILSVGLLYFLCDSIPLCIAEIIFWVITPLPTNFLCISDRKPW